MRVQTLASLSGSGSVIAVSYGVGHRCGSNLALLWLWCRPAAVALIRPLAWEPPHAAGAALEKTHTHTHTKSLACSWFVPSEAGPSFSHVSQRAEVTLPICPPLKCQR